MGRLFCFLVRRLIGISDFGIFSREWIIDSVSEMRNRTSTEFSNYF